MEDEMKVLIIAIGKCRKNSPEAQIIAEYIKRSGWEVVIKEKDNATQYFLWKFVREQIEEEAGVQNIVNLLKKAGDSGILFIDAKLDGCK